MKPARQHCTFLHCDRRATPGDDRCTVHLRIPPGPPLPSSWGSPGSLLAEKAPQEYDHIMTRHQEMIEMERRRLEDGA